MTPQNSDARTTAGSQTNAWRWRFGALATAGALALAGCGDDGDGTPDTKTYTYEASLTAFSSCDSLDDYLVDLATDAIVDGYVYGYYYGDAVGAGRDFAEDDVSAPTAGGDDGGGDNQGPSEFTDTNVQEVGVDEPDMMKTDGETLYVISGQTLHVIDSWPPEETNELATWELPGWGEYMFLADDRLVVFSHIYTGREPWYDDYDDRGVPEPAPDMPEADAGSAGSDGGSSAGSDGGAPDEGEDAGEDTPGADEPEGGADERPDEGWEEPDPDPLDDGVWFNGTRVTILDVSDPSAPTEAAVFDIEGEYVNARMVDGVVYLVSSSHLFNWYDAEFEEAGAGIEPPELASDATDAERAAAAADLRASVRPIVAEFVADRGRDALIPDIRTTADDRGNLFDCGDLMYPAARAGFGVLSVVGFDPSAPDPSGVGLLADGWQVYGSAESLYVAQDSRWWYWGGPDETFTATHIHKFGLNAGDPVYTASGEVEGWLLNQFSMSEFDGHLRVATTDESNFGFWGEPAVGGVDVDGGTTTDIDVSEPPETTEPDMGTDAGSAGGEGDAASGGGSDAAPPEQKTVIDLREGTDDADVDANNVFVLRQEGNVLEVVGGIRGIAPTERIYAVRFVGEMGYVVTFRQTDPLFTVDLSDPENPSLVGELHIPGYSGYLHPFGDDHLIGIGRAGDEDGRIFGVQLSVFDVSDPANPTRTAQHELDYGEGSYSWSEAEHDHHAFTFYESRNLLAIPITLEDWSYDDDTYSHFSGIIVFEVTEDGIEEFGRVSHTAMARDEYCGDGGGRDEGWGCEEWDYPWWVQMRRSYFADDYLFAVSDRGVTASALDAVSEVLAEVRY